MVQMSNKNKPFEKADRYKARIDSVRPLSDRETGYMGFIMD